MLRLVLATGGISWARDSLSLGDLLYLWGGRGRLLFSTLPLPLWLSEQHVVQARPYLTPRHMQYTVSLFLVPLLCSPLGLLLPHSCLSLMWGQGPLRLDFLTVSSPHCYAEEWEKAEARLEVRVSEQADGSDFPAYPTELGLQKDTHQSERNSCQYVAVQSQ